MLGTKHTLHHILRRVFFCSHDSLDHPGSSLEEILAVLGSNINSEGRRKRWMIAAKPPITMIQPSTESTIYLYDITILPWKDDITMIYLIYSYLSSISIIHRKDGARKPATFQVLEQFPKCAGMGQAWGKIAPWKVGKKHEETGTSQVQSWKIVRIPWDFYGI